MSGELTTNATPLLDETTRSFIKNAMAAGLVEIDQVKKVVASLLTDTVTFTPKLIADGLVGSGALTTWQANKLLAGKTKGFYLGSYRLLRPLGKGGMGVVYLGEHYVMKKLMALKILPAESLADKRRIERFKEEARASAQLDHPNIVQAYDFAETGEKLYIVMEYVDGIDLHYAVARDGVMSVAMAIDAVLQATHGLTHAHERGIIHRDIKPSNLLLRSDGVVKVSDMGLARIGWVDADDSEGQRRLMGTADFVAPEQALNSRTVDARADIYSLGCTLYYLLTGRPPFEGANVAQRLAKHQTAPPPDIRGLRNDCPAAVAELTMRMMAKRPEERPASAADLLAQLKRLSAQHGGSTSSPPLRRVAPAGDTAVDQAVYQDTIDDSSLSSDGEVPQVVVTDDFDFANLPPMETPKPIAPQPVTRANQSKAAKPVARQPATYSQPMAAPFQPHSPRPNNAPAARADHQQVLLGVGLAIAVIALLGTVGFTVFTLSKPPAQASPTIKSVEEGKDGKQIVIIRE